MDDEWGAVDIPANSPPPTGSATAAAAPTLTGAPPTLTGATVVDDAAAAAAAADFFRAVEPPAPPEPASSIVMDGKTKGASAATVAVFDCSRSSNADADDTADVAVGSAADTLEDAGCDTVESEDACRWPAAAAAPVSAAPSPPALSLPPEMRGNCCVETSADDERRRAGGSSIAAAPPPPDAPLDIICGGTDSGGGGGDGDLDGRDGAPPPEDGRRAMGCKGCTDVRDSDAAPDRAAPPCTAIFTCAVGGGAEKNVGGDTDGVNIGVAVGGGDASGGVSVGGSAADSTADGAASGRGRAGTASFAAAAARCFAVASRTRPSVSARADWMSAQASRRETSEAAAICASPPMTAAFASFCFDAKTRNWRGEESE